MRYGASRNHSTCSSVLPFLHIRCVKEGYTVKHLSCGKIKKKKKKKRKISSYVKGVFSDTSRLSRAPQKPETSPGKYKETSLVPLITSKHGKCNQRKLQSPLSLLDLTSILSWHDPFLLISNSFLVPAVPTHQISPLCTLTTCVFDITSQRVPASLSISAIWFHSKANNPAPHQSNK